MFDYLCVLLHFKGMLPTKCCNFFNSWNRKLDPKLSSQELQDVVKICSESVYPCLEAIDGDSDLWVS